MHWFLQGESLKFIGTPYWYLNSVSSSVSSHRQLISGCHQKLWIGVLGPDFLFSQDSHPTSGDLKPCAHVEVFLSRDHVDVNALLEWQLSRHLAVSITVVYSHLTGSATANFFRVPLLQASWCSLSLELPPGLPDIGLATTARFPIHDLGLLLHWHGIFNLESTKQSNYPDLKTTCFLYSCNSSADSCRVENRFGRTTTTSNGRRPQKLTEPDSAATHGGNPHPYGPCWRTSRQGQSVRSQKSSGIKRTCCNQLRFFALKKTSESWLKCLQLQLISSHFIAFMSLVNSASPICFSTGIIIASMILIMNLPDFWVGTCIAFKVCTA